MTPLIGFLGPLSGADGLLTLCFLLSLLYFAFASWRTGGGRASLVMLMAGLSYGCFELLRLGVQLGALVFPYTSGGETLWRVLRSGSDVIAIGKFVALLVTGAAFLKLALKARKSRRA